MPKQIHIDLRRDLPKVREQLEAILPNMGKCRYSAPCAIGAMVPEELRRPLDRLKDCGIGNLNIRTLVKLGAVSLPDEQLDDAQALQIIFDGPRIRADHFKAALARLEAKYLTGEVA